MSFSRITTTRINDYLTLLLIFHNRYVLPPTSRPRYDNNPVQQSHQQQQPPQQSQQPQPIQPQAKIISHPNQIVNDINQQQQQQSVPSLSVQYIPNYGFKYYAVVPPYTNVHPGYDQKSGYYGNKDKFNGKYNPKLKKYKAYEKFKYQPYYMVSLF